MKKFKARPYADKTKPKLKFVVNFNEGGKRARRFFESKTEAETFASLKNIELQNGGVEASQFPSDLRIEASRAAAALKPFGKSISDALAFYLPHLQAMNRSCTFPALVKELITLKKQDGASDVYLADLRHRLGRFADAFPKVSVSAVTSKEADDWLRALPVAPVTRNNFRRVLIVAFNFAVERGYCVANIFTKSAKAKEVTEAVQILTVEQTAALLAACSDETLPFVAIGAFAGLRTAELQRLDWSEIDFDAGLIQVTALKSKSAKRRFVRIQPNLAAWLQPHAKRKGAVAPLTLFKRLRRDKEAAGIQDWPDNALRHSFASYLLGHEQDAARVSLELGHGSSALVFKHYREIVKPKDAARYWQIMPAKVGNVVSMASAA